MKSKQKIEFITRTFCCVVAALIAPCIMPAAVKADFNGDGWGDLAVGVPGEGAVNVLYGSSKGLSTVGNQLITQNTGGCPEEAETGDGFGHALAAGLRR